MSIHASPHRSVIANAIYGVLNPIPFGFFVAALVFDIVYLRTAVIQWNKGAAWLIAIGLLFAVIPRLVNLAQVWITSRHSALRADRIDFWLNLVAIVAATINAFVHSRRLCFDARRRLALGLHGHAPGHGPHQCGCSADVARRTRP